MHSVIKKILRVLRIRFPEQLLLAPETITSSSAFNAVVLSAEDLVALEKKSVVSCGEGAIERVAAGTVVCIAVFDGENLAGICWYAIGAYVHTGTYIAHIHPDYICGYGLYIKPEYRGKNVRAALVKRAIEWTKEHNFKGVMAAIDIANRSSIMSAKKLGYRELGYSYFSRWLSPPKAVEHYYYLSSSEPHFFARQYRDFARLGAFNYFLDIGYRLVNKFIECRLLINYHFDADLTITPPESIQWFCGDAIAQLANRDMGIHREWLVTAVHDNQRAAAYFDEQGILKSYFWFSDVPVRTSAKYIAGVSSDYFYGYKAYTHPDVRGRGLFSRLVERTRFEAAKEGKKGIFTHVEVNNFASRKAHLNASGCFAGFHLLVKIGPFNRVFSSAKALSYGSFLKRCG